MPYTVLHAGDAFWRPSNQMGVLNTDLAKQLGATTLGARLWRLAPGQASTRHRHRAQHELYVLLEGTGRAHRGRQHAPDDAGAARRDLPGRADGPSSRAGERLVS